MLARGDNIPVEDGWKNGPSYGTATRVAQDRDNLHNLDATLASMQHDATFRLQRGIRAAEDSGRQDTTTGDHS
jgi:hypothetical protein